MVTRAASLMLQTAPYKPAEDDDARSYWTMTAIRATMMGQRDKVRIAMMTYPKLHDYFDDETFCCRAPLALQEHLQDINKRILRDRHDQVQTNKELDTNAKIERGNALSRWAAKWAKRPPTSASNLVASDYAVPSHSREAAELLQSMTTKQALAAKETAPSTSSQSSTPSLRRLSHLPMGMLPYFLTSPTPFPPCQGPTCSHPLAPLAFHRTS